ncbi:MAG: (2Fe-2S)-binding protein [Candidatus Sericytochromatia bacterium]|nr:(2Fe-2S)-binding protein [Candidatus Sericytochromatia bacterium]
MPTITINDVQHEVPAGINLVDAAALAGIEIPHYCYHPGLSIAGNCRMCLVEVEGARGLQIGCNTFVKDGLICRTNTQVVEDTRRGVMEFLLLNHPIDCPICDQAGECRLQDYYMAYGQYDHRSKEKKVQKGKAIEVGPNVVLDQERCILCSRCVRFCDEITKTSELTITGRGDHVQVETFPGIALDNPYSMNVVDVCPVGALTSKDFRFKMRVWWLETAKSVCTGCSKGCNTFLEARDGTAYRYRPRFNDDVNDYWMCDSGRLSYKSVNENRLTLPMISRVETTRALAISGAKERLAAVIKDFGPQAVAAVASPHASLEENLTLKRFMQEVIGSEQLFAFSTQPEGDSDDFLIEADKTPNRASFEILDLSRGLDAFEAELASGRIQALIVLRQDLIGQTDALAKKIATVPTLIVLGTHHDATGAAAHVLLPTTTHADSYGTYVNSAKRVQKFMAVNTPGDHMAPAWEWLTAIGMHLKTGWGYHDVENVWSELRKDVPALAGQSFYKLPENGVSLQPEMVVAP